MNIPLHHRLWLRVGQAAALCLMALLGLFDGVSGGLGDGEVNASDIPAMLWRVLLAVAAAAVWLPAHPSGSRRLPATAIVLAAGSFLTSAYTAALSIDKPAAWGLAETCGLLGVVYVVARRGDARPALWGVAATGMAIAALPLRGGQDPEYFIGGMFLALCAGGAAATGMYLRLAESGRERALATVRAEQRAEFARDLHDFIAHHVTGIVVQAQGAKFVAEQYPQRAITALEQIERAGAETMSQMRRMVGVLRDASTHPDAPLAPLGGVADLGPLLENFAATGPPAPRLHVDGDLGELPLEVSTSAYRVVMEALTNVRRHAHGAQAVDIWVRRTPAWLLVRVADDGMAARVAAPRDRSGYGLVGLGERVRAVGGRITAGPGIGDAGWVVDAALPLDREVAR